MTRRLADTRAVEMGLAALKDSEKEYREMSQRITGHYDDPRTLGKRQVLDTLVGEKQRMTRKTAEYVFDTLLGMGELVARSGTHFFMLGFNPYGVSSVATRYVLAETYHAQVTKTEKEQRNAQRAALMKDAQDAVLKQHSDEVETVYRRLCAIESLYPGREV